LRRVAFTLNNYTDADVERISGLGVNHKWCQALVYGREVGAKGTPHLQGYCEAATAKTFTTWKKWLGQGAHIEAAKASRTENYVYCTKEDKEPFTYLAEGAGDWIQPALVGYAALCEKINEGESLFISV